MVLYHFTTNTESVFIGLRKIISQRLVDNRETLFDDYRQRFLRISTNYSVVSKNWAQLVVIVDKCLESIDIKVFICYHRCVFTRG